MKKIIGYFTVLLLTVGLLSCSHTEEGVTIQSNTGVMSSGNIIKNTPIVGITEEPERAKKGCKITYESISKSYLVKRNFSFFIEGDCEDKIINGTSIQEGNLLETPSGIKFEIQDLSSLLNMSEISYMIQNPPEERSVLIKNFITQRIENTMDIEINLSKYTVYDDHNKQVIENKIVGNFGGFIISNYSESFQKNLNENNIDQTYNELKTILSTVKELPSINIVFSYETVDLSNVIVKGNTFILKDENGLEKVVKIDQTKIYRDFTIEEFEYECRRNCRFSAIKGNLLEWEIELLGGNYFLATTNIETGDNFLGGFESSGGFDNFD